MNKNVKAIVVACNTASSVALQEIKNHFHVPVIGMIEPGAAAVKFNRQRENRCNRYKSYD
jgi:glutamate racemase